jgi:hypothetical protein
MEVALVVAELLKGRNFISTSDSHECQEVPFTVALIIAFRVIEFEKHSLELTPIGSMIICHPFNCLPDTRGAVLANCRALLCFLGDMATVEEAFIMIQEVTDVTVVTLELLGCCLGSRQRHVEN